MKYQYEWKNLTMPLPDVPVDSEIGRAMVRAKEIEDHDIKMIVVGEGIVSSKKTHDDCWICKMRHDYDPGDTTMAGRWGKE